MPPSERRRAILERIASFVCKDRQNTYGDAEDNFRDIAERWTIYVRRRFGLPNFKLEPADIAAMMIDVKLARIAASPGHQDNWDDAGGYAVCGAGIIEGSGEKLLSQSANGTPTKRPSEYRRKSDGVCTECRAGQGTEHGPSCSWWKSMSGSKK